MMHLREAVVLAGGFGTRLAHIVPDVCKPMAPVAGQPFLRILLNQLSEAGFSRIVIADGYRKEQIEEYFGSCYRGMEIIYSSEESPLLTGGAVKKAMKYCDSDYIFVLNGDTYCDVDFLGMEQFLVDNKFQPEAVIAIKQMSDFSRYGSIEVSEKWEIERFLEKTYRRSGYINTGTYLLRRHALDHMPDVFSLEQDYFEKKVSSAQIYAYPTDGLFIDIGVPEDYERAQKILLTLNHEWKLAIFDRDGTINVDTGHLFEPEKLMLVESMIPVLEAFSNAPNYKVVVVTNQAGIAKGLYSADQMYSLHHHLNDMLLQRNCRVDAYYYCPHHPDYTGECSCRKPNPGLILRALSDYNVAPENCVMFGDKETDEVAARSANVQFAMVGDDESIRRAMMSIAK